MDLRVGLWRKLSTEELMLLNRGVGEDSWESWQSWLSWTARRSNQSILKEISPGISLEGMTLKLKLQYFGHLMQRADALEKTLLLAGTGGRRKRGQQRVRWLDGITGSMDVSLSELRELVMDREAWFMGSQRVGYDWATELNWTELKINADGDCSHEIKTLVSWKKSYGQPRHILKKHRHSCANKGPISQSYGFSSSHV